MDTKVKTINITPTWETCWKTWLNTGKIDKNTYDLFLPVMIAQDERNKENESDDKRPE